MPRLWIVLAGFAAFLGVIVVTVYLGAPWAVGAVVRSYLADQGFPDARLEVTHLGLTRVDMINVSLGPKTEVSAQKLSVDYSPSRLANRLVDGVSVSGATLPLRIGADGIGWGALQPFVDGAGEATGDQASVRILGPITLRDASLILASPFGEVTADLDGTLLMTDGLGTKIRAEIALAHPEATLRGRLNGIVDAGATVQMDLLIDDATSTGRLAFTKLTGALRVDGEVPLKLDGAGTLTVSGVRLDGVSVGNLDVSGTLTDTAATLDVILGGAETGISAHAELATEDVLDPEATVHLSGDMATDGLRGPAGLPGGASVIGAVAFAAEGRRSDVQAFLKALASGAADIPAPLSGWLDIDHLTVTDPASGSEATLNGRLDMLANAAAWRVSLADTFGLELGAAIGGETRRISAKLSALDDAPLLTGGFGSARPIIVATHVGGRLDGAYPVSGRVTAAVWPDGDAGALIETLRLDLDPHTVKLAGLDVAIERASVDLTGAPDGMAAEVVLDADVSGRPAKGVNIAGGRISLQSRIDFGDGAISAHPPGCLDIQIAELRTSAAVLRPQPMKVCPSADGAPLAMVSYDADGLKRVDFKGVFGSTEIAVEGLGAYPLTGQLPRLEANGSFDGVRAAWWTAVTSSGGEIRAEGPDVAAGDLRATVNLQGLGKDLVGGTLALNGLRMIDHRRPLRFRPLALSGDGKISGGAATFDGTLAADAGLNATVKATHELNNGKGALTLNVADWTLSSGGHQPQAALTILQGIVTAVSGTIAAKADVAWGAEGMRSSGQIGLRQLGFGTQPAEVAGIDADIAFTSLAPVKSEGAQPFEIAFLDAGGVPLTNGTGTVSFPGDETAVIQDLSWPFAGGRIGIGRLQMPFDRLPENVTVDVTALDAGSLAKMIDVADLGAEGTLTGRLPLTLTADGPVIENAKLRSVGGGMLRYRAEGAALALRQGGNSGDILARALENFQFTDIDMTLNGPLGGEIVARAEIKGANPDLYDGKRIELNVNLRGVLRDLLRSANVMKELPEAVRDQVQGLSGKP